MKIEKAIEANELIVKYPKTPIGLYTLKAIQLGIEALKREQEWRQLNPTQAHSLLLGETKD